MTQSAGGQECTANITNSSWTDWLNISCLSGNIMNQTRNNTQYDSNNCGGAKNTATIIFYNYFLFRAPRPYCDRMTAGLYCDD